MDDSTDEKLRSIEALSHEDKMLMARLALQGYRFVLFPSNIDYRQWKALRNGAEVGTAATLLSLLGYMEAYHDRS